MPPPLPRSSTTSPGLSAASAVGLPQPSDANSAASGMEAASTSSYSPLEMASPSQHLSSPLALPLQQAAPCPLKTACAAAPYFSRTISRTSARSVNLIVSAIVVFLVSAASAAVFAVRTVVSQIGGERGHRLPVHAADHVFAAPLDRDKPGQAKLFEV